MRKVLVPVDGSDNALRALRHVITEAPSFREPSCLVLVNVQAPVASGAVRMFIPRGQIDDFHREEGEASLAAARDLAASSGLAVEHHILVGDAAESIARFARESGCQLIAMGTRGLGTVSGMMLGSVAHKVVHLSEVPVLLVR